jgi:nucleoside 2-deoxyribosyltransferase
MKIYLAHPISGMTPEAVIDYYENLVKGLSDVGYDCLYPMIAKGYLRTDPKYRGEPLVTNGITNPVSTNHAIVERDKWMVTQSDIVLVDFSGAKIVSIGSCMELAWASLLGKHTIVVMDAEGLHKHAFILDCADIVFEKAGEAFEYLSKLQRKQT